MTVDGAQTAIHSMVAGRRSCSEFIYRQGTHLDHVLTGLLSASVSAGVVWRGSKEGRLGPRASEGTVGCAHGVYHLCT